MDAENLIPVSEKPKEADKTESFFIRHAWVFLDMFVIIIAILILSVL